MNVNSLNTFEDATGGRAGSWVGGVGQMRGDTNSNESNHKRPDKLTVNCLCRVKQMSELELKYRCTASVPVVSTQGKERYMHHDN